MTSATALPSTAASVATWLTAIGTIAASVLALAFGLARAGESRSDAAG